jgi:predicted adenylyl cyclase CyaB
MLQNILSRACGVKIVVDKMRDIYFIDNVKFHVDEVKDLGTFVEIEAIDTTGSVSQEQLHNQVIGYQEKLGIGNDHLLTHSYSDMLASCV